MKKEQSFMEYIEAVDRAMMRLYGIDTGDAGIELDELAAAQEECTSPQKYALWHGEKYGLDLIERKEK